MRAFTDIRLALATRLGRRGRRRGLLALAARRRPARAGARHLRVGRLPPGDGRRGADLVTPMSPIPDFVVDDPRARSAHHPLWLPGVTAVDHAAATRCCWSSASDNGRWTPVTGIVDPGEEPAVAAAREAMEETGVAIRVDRLAVDRRAPRGRPTPTATAPPTSTSPSPAPGSRARPTSPTTSRATCAGGRSPALPPMSELMLGRIEAATSDEREARFVAPDGPGRRRAAAGARARRARARRRRLPGRLGRRRASTPTAGRRSSSPPRSPALVALVRETYDVAVVAVDIPIGLPDDGGRLADAEARRELVGKSSSVFSTPVRAALEAPTYEAGPRGQPRRDRRAHQRQRPGVRPAREGPPGRRLGARPARRRGRRGAPRAELRADGRRARCWRARRTPTAYAPAARRSPRTGSSRRRGSAAPGFGEDDLLDACAAAWSAVRHSLGRLGVVPRDARRSSPTGSRPRSGCEASARVGEHAVALARGERPARGRHRDQRDGEHQARRGPASRSRPSRRTAASRPAARRRR